MNIIVVGCGKIGFSIVSDLINEGHDITVIDTDNSTVEEITNDLKSISDIIPLLYHLCSF